MSFTYRRLQPHEAGIYRSLRLEALKNHPDNFDSTYAAESAKPKLSFEESIEHQSTDRFIMGAFYNNRLIGICGFSQEPLGKFHHKGSIIQMYVNPEFKGNKTGFHLLIATANEAFITTEVEQLILGVVATNMAANRIYEQVGFKEYGFHKGYQKNGDAYSDERLMILYRPV